MSQKVPYVKVKTVVQEMIDGFFQTGFDMHGWSKEEFYANYKQELIAEIDEETYDIVLSAPETLQ